MIDLLEQPQSDPWGRLLDYVRKRNRSGEKLYAIAKDFGVSRAKKTDHNGWALQFGRH